LRKPYLLTLFWSHWRCLHHSGFGLELALQGLGNWPLLLLLLPQLLLRESCWQGRHSRCVPLACRHHRIMACMPNWR
jgi:hypothetical protein